MGSVSGYELRGFAGSRIYAQNARLISRQVPDADQQAAPIRMRSQRECSAVALETGFESAARAGRHIHLFEKLRPIRCSMLHTVEINARAARGPGHVIWHADRKSVV